MSQHVSTEASRVASERVASRVTGLRHASFAALVILLIQYGIGMYANLYVTVPAADHGQGFGKIISNGPAALSIHTTLGLLLILAAVGLLVQALIARRWTVLTSAVIALAAIIGAAVEGARFAAQGPDSASMTMALLAGVAMLCYGSVLYLLPSPRRER
jgi:hypothetical protein